MKILTLVCLVFLHGTVAWAEDPDQLLEQLRAELRTELKSALDKGNVENNERLYRIETLLVENLPAGSITTGNPRQVLATLGQIRGLSRSAKVEALSQKLIDELRVVSVKQRKELAQSIQNTLRESLRAGLNATTAKEVDEPIGAVLKVQKQVHAIMDRENPNPEVSSEQVQTVHGILTMWQDSLLGFGGRQQRNTLEQFDYMTSNYSSHVADLMPRSEFLERIQAARQKLAPAVEKKPNTAEAAADNANQVREIVRAISKLDDIAPAIAKIDAIYSKRSEGGYVNESASVRTLRGYRKTYEELKAGHAVTIGFAGSPQSSGDISNEDLNAVKMMLVRFAVPRVLGVDGDLKENEPLADYLSHVATSAQKAVDLPLLGRVLDTAQTLGITTVASTNDTSAMRLVLAGSNQERARQHSAAVASYLGALKSGSQAIPAEWIGDRLDAIKNSHPQAYELGQQPQVDERLSGRMSPYPPGYPGIRPGSSPPLNQSSALQVPAAKKPEPKPEPASPPATKPESQTPKSESQPKL